MIARLAFRPMMSGKTKVAPNMATTCWAPSPMVLPQASRWFGATASPGAGSTTSHLNIDDTVDPFPLGLDPVDQSPDNPQRSNAIRHPRRRQLPKERRYDWQVVRS